MTRRGLLALALASAGCAGAPATVTETIDAGTVTFPVLPGLVVPEVSLPPTREGRAAATEAARAGLLRGIGERPVAEPAPEALLLRQAQARLLPRVVRMTVVRAGSARSGAFGVTTVEAAIRLRVLDAATGWVVGDATFLRRSRSGEDVAEAVAALAAGLLA